MSVRLSAGGESCMPFSSSLATMKASMRFVMRDRDGWPRDGLERPMVLAAALASGDGLAGARVGRAHLDPGDQVLDLFVRKLVAFGRHLEIGIGVADSLDEKTLLRVSGHDGRAGGTTFENAFARVQQQFALQLERLRAVALVAVLREQRADF